MKAISKRSARSRHRRVSAAASCVPRAFAGFWHGTTPYHLHVRYLLMPVKIILSRIIEVIAFRVPVDSIDIILDENNERVESNRPLARSRSTHVDLLYMYRVQFVCAKYKLGDRE